MNNKDTFMGFLLAVVAFLFGAICLLVKRVLDWSRINQESLNSICSYINLKEEEEQQKSQLQGYAVGFQVPNGAEEDLSEEEDSFKIGFH